MCSLTIDWCLWRRGRVACLCVWTHATHWLWRCPSLGGHVSGALLCGCSPATMKRAASMASMMSIDEDEMSTEAKQCLTALREGKRCV